MGSISKWVDVIWDQLVDKPECLGERRKAKRKTMKHDKDLGPVKKHHKSTLIKSDFIHPIMSTKATHPSKYFNRILTHGLLGNQLWISWSIMTTERRILLNEFGWMFLIFKVNWNLMPFKIGSRHWRIILVGIVYRLTQ